MKPIPSALAAPWAVEAGWLRAAHAVWSRGKLDAAALAQAKAEWEARKSSRPRLDEPGAPVEGTGGTLRIVGDVGVISIEGALFRHANLISDFSGGTTYDALWRGLEAAVASRQVNTILLRVNSPGGEADGVSELAKGIKAAAEQKPVYAYVDGMCASAAYWLASQSDRIYAEESSEIGSIGVRCGIVDDSAADEMAGIREIEVISSQSPAKRSKPVNDAVVSRLQTRIDDLADIFIAAVADGRGVSTKKVSEDFGQGDVMIASKALEAGLIDEIGNFNGTLAAIAAAATGGQGARAEVRTMAIKEATKPTADKMDGDGEWQCAGCKEMMGKSADAYCAKCSEDDEEPDGDEDEAKALGLDVKATADQRRARMVALAAFEKQVLASTGSVDAASALGKVSAGMLAIGESEKHRAEMEAQKSAAIRGQFKTALEDKRLSLGHLTAVIPTFISDAPGKDGEPSPRAKVQTAIEKSVASQKREDLVAAICGVEMPIEAVSSALASVQAFASVQAGMPEAPRREPPLDAKNRLHIVSVSKDEAAKYGMKPESFEKYANITSVDQIERPTQKQGA